MLTFVSLVVVSLGGVVLADADSASLPRPAAHLLVVPRTPAGVAALARSDARVVARYDSYSLVESSSDDAGLRAAGADRRDDMRTVATAAGSFDPLDRVSLAAKWAPERDEALALVQFIGPPKEDWLARLRATGARVVTYQAENAYVVHARGAAVERLVALVGTDPAVRAIVPLGRADKVEGLAAGTARYAVSLVGGRSYRTLSPEQVEALAGDPSVVAIERDADPSPTDERADQIVAGNLSPFTPTYLSWVDGRVGPSSTIVDVTDSGLYTAHPDLAGKLAYANDKANDGDTVDCTGHGTAAASIAAGLNTSNADSAGFSHGLGVAPRASIGVSKIYNCNGSFSSTFSASDVASDAYAGGARVSNNSWGTNGTDYWGTYSDRAQDYDELVRDAGAEGLTEVFSAGNDGQTGEGTITAEGSAKNVITVGASESVRASGTDGCGITNAAADNANQTAVFSSRGPTDDGRLKPDLVAPGTHITAARSSPLATGMCTPNFAAGYALGSGTSLAAPQVAGAAALVRDWFSPTQPSPALVKALLINSASDLGGGPNNQQGWGRLNIGAALDPTLQRGYYDQLPGDRRTTTGTTVVRSFTVPASTRPVKVTLVWTDPAGSPTGAAYVNDLDLQVAAGGRTYRGNVFNGAWSRPGGSADPRNNVESVYLPAGSATRFSVTVRATTLAGDGAPGGDATDQDFALVVSNATESAAPMLTHVNTQVSGGDGDGVLESDEQVSLLEQLLNAGNATASGLSATLTGSSGLAVRQGSSGYANIAAEAAGINSTPFVVHLANAATCGADVGASLSITTNAGTQTVPLVLATGAPGPLLSNPSGDVPKAIPDNNATGVSSSVFVAERGVIKDLNVTLPSPGIVHPSVGDLVVDLIGPDGTRVRLADHPGGPDNGAANMSGTTFDDQAATNISQGSAPFAGNFRPQNDQLSRFNGKSRRGTWTLRVRDLFAGGIGTLARWGLASQKARCDVDASAPDTVIGAGPQNPTTSSSAQFAIGSPDATASFECRLDSGVWGPCGKSVSYSGLALGAHSFAARAIDGSDNEDPSPATYRWTVTQPAAGFLLAPVEERLSTAIGGGYRVLAACASVCRASAKLSVPGRTARKLHLGRRATTLGSGAKRRTSAGGATVALRLTRRARAALRKRASVKATLSMTLTQGSAKLTLKRTVSLRRGAGLKRIASRGLRLWVTATRSSPLSGTLSLSGRQAKRIGLKPGDRKRMTIATASTTASATPKLLTLKPGRSVRRAFARARRVATLLEAVAGRAPEPLRTAKLSKTLVR